MHCISQLSKCITRINKPFFKRICFVTVSSRLSSKLQKQFNEVNKIVDERLPPCQFFSLNELLCQILHVKQVEWDFKDIHTFRDYMRSRTSHLDVVIEETLIENEIGGVIMGSLLAAIKKRPLTRDEYLQEISNEGLEQRISIYD